MAEVVCSKCGALVSTTLIACPACGTPVGYRGGTKTDEASKAAAAAIVQESPAASTAVETGVDNSLFMPKDETFARAHAEAEVQKFAAQGRRAVRDWVTPRRTMGFSDEELADAMAEKSLALNRDEALRLIAESDREMRAELRSEKRHEALVHLGIGLFFVLLGSLLTASSWLVDASGPLVLFWGALAYGGYRLIRALLVYLESNG